MPSGGQAATWRYEVVPGSDARDLRIEAWFPDGSLADLVVKPGAERYISDVQVEDDDGWRTVARHESAMHAPECSRGCHVRYRFALRRAAEAMRDIDQAIAWGPVVEASPSLWLLHPSLTPAATRYRFHVRTAPDLDFATGVFLAEDGPSGTYEAEASNIDIAPYAAFGPMRFGHVAAAGSALDIAIAPGDLAVSDDALSAWISRSARTMARFFGCFPVERVLVLVVPVEGDTVRHGETMGDGGATIVVELGQSAGPDALDDDWVLPHEMTHLAIPSVSQRHHWLEEGLAVYLEPIARARAGELRPEDVWREFAVGMPKGRVGDGPRRHAGLDDARDWARVYWGGATFCLQADMEIRRRTGNRLGLEDAMRGLLASGGNIARFWDFGRLLKTADEAVGAPVLALLHQEMGAGVWRVDLPQMLRDLGVVVHGESVTLLDDAPLAAVRRSITEPRAASQPEPLVCRGGALGRMAQR
jgi:hypothetical protein